MRLPVYALGFLLAFRVAAAAGATAHFWISNSDDGPEAPIVDVLAEAVGEIQIWGRPAPGRVLNAFSLNLVSETPGALEFQEIVVHNPTVQGMLDTFRHQLVFDSAAGLNIQPDAIEKFAGITVLNDVDNISNGSGIGPNCLDDQCFTGSGDPSWLLATVTFTAGDAGASTDLYLEIGELGIWHADEEPIQTSAVFGAPGDVVHEWDTADGPDVWSVHMGLPDAQVNVVSTIANADFDEDGDVDGADFSIWQRGYGGSGGLSEGDATGDGSIDGDDLAVWEMQFGSGAASVAGTSVPELRSLTASILAVACGWLTCWLSVRPAPRRRWSAS